MLTDEYNLYHAVAILFVPVAKQSRLLSHQLDEVFFGSGGIPQSCFGYLFLYACLFKEEGHVAVVAEVAHAFGTDDVLRPFGGDKIVELVYVERRTAVIDEGADAIFLHLSAFVVVMVMVVMFVMLFVMRVLPFMVMGVVRLPLFLFGDLPFDAPNRSGGGGGACKGEEVCAEELFQIHVSVVACYDLGAGLQCAENLLDAFQFFRFHFVGFVQQDDVAKLNLLYDEVFDVLLINAFSGQVVAAGKLALQAQRIDHGRDAVQVADAVFGVGASHAWDGADGLCDGFRFADAACFDDDIVEALHFHDFEYLFYQVCPQRAADAAVLQRNEAFVLLAHDAPFLYEVRIDVHLSYVVDDDGKLDASFVGEDVVHQGGFAATEVAGQEEDGDF